jgi:hypothetical protein
MLIDATGGVHRGGGGRMGIEEAVIEVARLSSSFDDLGLG